MIVGAKGESFCEPSLHCLLIAKGELLQPVFSQGEGQWHGIEHPDIEKSTRSVDLSWVGLQHMQFNTLLVAPRGRVGCCHFVYL